MNFFYNLPNIDLSSFMDLANSSMSQALLENMSLHAEAEGPTLETMTADSVALTEQAETTAALQAFGVAGDLEKFSQSFTKDDLASLFGVDPKSLTDDRLSNSPSFFTT